MGGEGRGHKKDLAKGPRDQHGAGHLILLSIIKFLSLKSDLRSGS